MKRELLFAAVVLAATSQAHAVCFVNQKASGMNDGTSWSDAYVALDSALGSATCSEIWVAEGVYKPSSSSLMFALSPRVALYGGFAGTETMLAQRDFVAHVTVLSGDVDDNDANVTTNQIDDTTADIVGSNSPSVIVLDASSGRSFSSTTIVDGLTITGASSDAGLSCTGTGECSPTLRNLTFSGNEGGGASFFGGGATLSSPTVADSSFRGNSIAGGSGGAISAGTFDGPGIALQISDVVFERNSARYGGGAIYMHVYSSDASKLSVERSRFYQNSADASTGGAIYVSQSYSTAVDVDVVGTTFDSNSAFLAGAILFESEQSPMTTAISNTTFAGNTSVQGGGLFLNLIHASGSTNTLNNVTFAGNRAVGDGMTTGRGGAIYLYNEPATTDEVLAVNNTILWQDVADYPVAGPEIFNDTSSGGATATVAHSVADGGCPIGVTCSDVSSADPMLAPLGYHWGATPVMRPGIYGSAVNAGDDSTCEATDQRNFPRPQGKHCDIGSVEMRLPSDDILYPSGF